MSGRGFVKGSGEQTEGQERFRERASWNCVSQNRGVGKMKRDLRFAIRMLLKQPGFSLIAVLTLALGIGVTSAVFSLIQGVVLTTPPYKKPQQLVLVQSARTDGQK